MTENYEKAWDMLTKFSFPDKIFVRDSFVKFGKSIAESSKVSKKDGYYTHQDLPNLAFESESEAIFAASLKRFLPADTNQETFQQIFSIILKLGNVNSEWTFNKEKG